MEEINIKDLQHKDAYNVLAECIKSHSEQDVITNLQVATLLQDFMEELVPMNVSISLGPKPGPYEIGNINNSKVFIDPNMSWIDTRLIFTNDKMKIEEVLIIHSNNLF